MQELFNIDSNEWKGEMDRTKMFFDTFAENKMPKQMYSILQQLQDKL